MRFHAHDRILEILVGSNLYPGPDVSIRELVQNAWDAIELRRAYGDGVGGRIVVRYSKSERYFEVEDDGIGMSEQDMEDSFLAVGSDKLEVLGAAGQAGEQVAIFGIGVLSVFLVARSLEVRTRKFSQEQGLRLRIEGLEDERDPETIPLDQIGTTIHVQVRDDAPFNVAEIPEAVRKYARHLTGIFIEDVDSGERTETQEAWDTEGLLDVSTLPDDGRAREGRLGFLRTLTEDTPVVSNRLTLCNVGFLVESGAIDLLQSNPMGFAGEVDLHAAALTVVMARERFQRDTKWADLGHGLLDAFEQRALEALDSGFLANGGGFDAPEVRRALSAWHWALREASILVDLKSAVQERILTTVPFPLAGRSGQTSLRAAVERLPAPRLYFRRVGSPAYMSRVIDDEGLPINLSEEIQYGIRVGALRARGFPVIETGVFNMTWQTPQQPQPVTYGVDEVQIVIDCLSATGVTVMDISQAPDEDLDFASYERLPVLRQILNIGGTQLRLARVPESERRVIVDPSGVRYLNVANPRIERLLKVLPEAISNPLKRRMLRVYLGLETFDLTEARNTLLSLLEEDNLDSMAQVHTSVLTQGATKRAIERLLSEQETA